MNWSFTRVLGTLLILSGCSVSPPKPPTCSGADRHPINLQHQPVAVVTPAVDTCSRG